MIQKCESVWVLAWDCCMLPPKWFELDVAQAIYSWCLSKAICRNYPMGSCWVLGTWQSSCKPGECLTTRLVFVIVLWIFDCIGDWSICTEFGPSYWCPWDNSLSVSVFPQWPTIPNYTCDIYVLLDGSLWNNNWPAWEPENNILIENTCNCESAHGHLENHGLSWMEQLEHWCLSTGPLNSLECRLHIPSTIPLGWTFPFDIIRQL